MGRFGNVVRTTIAAGAMALAMGAAPAPAAADQTMDRLVQIQRGEGQKRGPECLPDKPADGSQMRRWTTEMYLAPAPADDCGTKVMGAVCTEPDPTADPLWRRPSCLEEKVQLKGRDTVVFLRNDARTIPVENANNGMYLAFSTTGQPEMRNAALPPWNFVKLNNETGTAPLGNTADNYRLKLSARAGQQGNGAGIKAQTIDNLTTRFYTGPGGVTSVVNAQVVDGCPVGGSYSLRVTGDAAVPMSLAVLDQATGQTQKIVVNKGSVNGNYKLNAPCAAATPTQVPYATSLDSFAASATDLGLSFNGQCACPAGDTVCETDVKLLYDGAMGIGRNPIVAIQPASCSGIAVPAGSSSRTYALTGYLVDGDGTPCGTGLGGARKIGTAMIDLGQGDVAPMRVVASSGSGMEIGLGGYDPATGSPKTDFKVDLGTLGSSSGVYMPKVKDVVACATYERAKFCPPQ